MRTEVKVKVEKDGSLTRSEIKPIYKKREDCRACHGTTLQEVIRLGTQYLVNFVPDIDVSLPKAPLTMVRCDKCGLLRHCIRWTLNSVPRLGTDPVSTSPCATPCTTSSGASRPMPT
jgi:hypothetical protein